jgi:signal peptidase I
MFQLRPSWVCRGWRIVPIVAAIVAVLGLQGCGGTSSESEIRASVDAYLTALATHDAAGACAVITPAYWSATAQAANAELAGRSVAALPGNACRRGLGQLFSISTAKSVVPQFTLTDVVVHGHTATGSLTTGASASVSAGQDAGFIRGANGVWRIDCCAGTQIDRLPTATYRVPSGSMEPTLKIGQTVTSDNAAMRAHPPALGAIVVFHPPKNYALGCPDPNQGQSGGPDEQPCGVAGTQESSEEFIKRVVGLPGDRIAIVNGHVYRNGVRERDSYITPCGVASICAFPVPITVPRGDYYMLGDNRGASDDSRFWGPVKRSWIIGVLEG